MLEELSRFASPEIEHLMKQLDARENSFQQELRSLNRKKLVVPVTVSTADNEFRLNVFSRNISEHGISVISPQPFGKGDEMNFSLALHSSKNRRFAGNCIWSRRFGEAYWISGWSSNSKLDVEKILQSDGLIDWECRDSDRQRYAIPVVINLISTKLRVPAFTRDLSDEGVSLVAAHTIKKDEASVLDIVGSDDQRCKVIAQCAWSTQFDENHWVTGWHFFNQS